MLLRYFENDYEIIKSSCKRYTIYTSCNDRDINNLINAEKDVLLNIITSNSEIETN